MADTSSVSAIKRRLQDLGLSTATPGVVGEERYEELKRRLEGHNRVLGGSQKIDASEISIADLRDRLSALGESTSTPGLAGEERRDELKRRLMMAICGSQDSSGDAGGAKKDEQGEYFQDMPAAVYGKVQMVAAPKPVVTVPPPPKDPPPPSVVPAVLPKSLQEDEQVVGQEEEGKKQLGIDLVEPSQAEISERKKLLKRLVNKRALAVAARLSGSSQDKELKESERQASQADVEIARIKGLKQSVPGRVASSLLVEKGVSMSLDKLLAQLETVKLEAKDKVRLHRVRIREEEDNNPDYGVDAEERLNAAIREVSYIKGRTRRRIDEYKSIVGINDSAVLQDEEPPSPTNKELLNSCRSGNSIATAAARGGGGFAQPKKIIAEQPKELKESIAATITGAAATTGATATISVARASPVPLGLSERLSAANIPLPPAIAIPSTSISPSEFTPTNRRKLVSPPLVRRDSTASSASGVSIDSLTENMTEYNIDMLAPPPEIMRPSAASSFAPSSSAASMAGVGVAATAAVATSSTAAAGSSSGSKVKHASTSTTSTTTLAAGSKLRSSSPAVVSVTQQITTAPTAAKVAPPPPSTLVASSSFVEGEAGKKKKVAGDKQSASSTASGAAGTSRMSELKAQYLSGAAVHVPGDDDNMFRADHQHDEEANKYNTTPSSRHAGTEEEGDGDGDDDQEDGDDDDDSVDQEEDEEESGSDGEEDEEEDSEDDTEATAARAAAWMAKRTVVPPPVQQQPVGGPPSAPPRHHAHPPGTVPPSSSSSTAVATTVAATARGGGEKGGDVGGNNDDLPLSSSSSSLTASVAAAAVKKGPQAYIEAAQMLAAADRPPSKSSLLKQVSCPKESAEDIIKATKPSSKPSSAATGERTRSGMSAREAAAIAASRSASAAAAVNQDHGTSDNEEDDDDDENDFAKQMKALRDHAKVLESVNDLDACEAIYLRALQLDPLDVRTLSSFAVFLHRRRGEMSRAEAFFGRGLQVCLPSLFNTLSSSSRRKMPPHLPTTTATASADGDGDGDLSDATMTAAAASAAPVTTSATTAAAAPVNEQGETPPAGGVSLPPQNKPPPPASAPPPPHNKGSGSRIKAAVITKLLISYAGFLTRAQGDIDNAVIVYRKAVEISPDNASVLGATAHFMAKEGVCLDEALDLFSKALKSDPDNALHALWYAKLLRKKGRIGQAEIMYKVAVQKSKGTAPYSTLNSSGTASSSVEASALCNYATFLFRQRKDPLKAQEIFADALARFPFHKGLIKNYSYLLLAHPELNPHPELKLHLPNTSTGSRSGKPQRASASNPNPNPNPYIAVAVNITEENQLSGLAGGRTYNSPSLSVDGSAHTDTEEGRPPQKGKPQQQKLQGGGAGVGSGSASSYPSHHRAAVAAGGPMPSPEKQTGTTASAAAAGGSSSGTGSLNDVGGVAARARRPSFPPLNNNYSNSLHHHSTTTSSSVAAAMSLSSGMRPNSPNSIMTAEEPSDPQPKKRSSGRRESLKRIQNVLAATAQQQYKASSPHNSTTIATDK